MRLRTFIVYKIFTLLSLFCRLIGREGTVALGYLLGLALTVLTRPKGRILQNMTRVMGRRRAYLAMRKYFEHMGLMISEYLWMNYASKEEIDSMLEVTDITELKRAYDRGQGVICMLGHIGNWEFAGHSLVLNNLKLETIFRALKNPLIDERLRAMRERTGIVVHSQKDGGLKGFIRAIRDGKLAVLLVDQSAGKQGVQVPMFGKIASTFSTTARVAIKTGAPIIPIYSHRYKRRIQCFSIGEEVKVADTGDRESDILITTWRCNKALERVIMRAPAQWLWRHKRWWDKPKAADLLLWEKAKAADEQSK